MKKFLNKIIKSKMLRKRMVSIMMVIIVIMAYLPMSLVFDELNIKPRLKVKAAGTGTEIRFTSIGQFEEYVTTYNANPSAHKNDILRFAYSGSSTSTEYNCGSIGLTESAAFDGKIILSTGTRFNLTEPLFGYVTDDVVIVDSTDHAETMVFTRPRPGNNKSLFAEHVVQSRDSGDPVEWRFEYSPFSTGGKHYVYDFAGFIGTLETGAKVRVSSVKFNNLGADSSGTVHANITGNEVGDAGLVCCTMKQKSELEVDLIGSSSSSVEKSFSITAGAGHAGGLVGSMAEGSKLTISNSLENIQDVDALISAPSGYAGGLVGKCDGGLIERKAVAVEDLSYPILVPIDVFMREDIELADPLAPEEDSSEENTSEEVTSEEEFTSEEEISSEEVTSEEEITSEETTSEEEITSEEVIPEEEIASEEVTPEEEITSEEVIPEEEIASEEVTPEEEVLDNSNNLRGSRNLSAMGTLEGPDGVDDLFPDSGNQEGEDQADIEEPADKPEDSSEEVSNQENSELMDEETSDISEPSSEEKEQESSTPKDEEEKSEKQDIDKDKEIFDAEILEDEELTMEILKHTFRIVDAALGIGSSDYQVSQNISGKNGSGGVAGYYRASTFNSSVNATISTDIVDLKTKQYKVNNTGACGGLFGEVFNDGTEMSITVDAEVKPDHTINTAASYGGLIGKYYASAQNLSLTVSGTSTISPKRTGEGATNYGGVIGIVDTYTPSGGSKTSAYVKINGITVDSKNANTDGCFGGVIAKADEAFIELSALDSGSNVISYSGIANNKNFAGVVGSLETGVLYLCDGTDLRGAATISGGTEKSGQIVGYRNCGFVFAESGWKLYRSTIGQKVDDIGSWGEVIRFNDSTFKMTDVLTLDSTNHYVQIKKRGSFKDIANIADFAIVAFNIQHNNAGSSTGVLRFEGTTSWKSSTILSSDMSFKATTPIDLRGTGITGLTRDNNYSSDDVTSFLQYGNKNTNGNGSTIILAIGEEYGESRSTSYGNGTIYRHKYNGLFAKFNGSTFNGNTTYTNLTISSNSVINVEACVKDVLVGPLVAYTSGNVTIKDVKSDVTINHAGSGSDFYVGGIVGKTNGSITIEKWPGKLGCSFNGSILGRSNGSTAIVGGLIGGISGNAFTSVINEASVTGMIIKSEGSQADQKIGGLIGVISNSDSASSGRTLTLKQISIDGAEVNGNATNSSGGLLGYSWYKTDVVFGDGTNTGVEVKGSSKMVTTAKNASEMMYAATGYWKVNTNGINITEATAEAESASDSFGVLINKGTLTGKSAIYLELARNGFVITSLDTSKLKSTVAVFDELVAYSKFDGTDILDNGQGIVSINTYDGTNNSSKLLKMGNSDDANTGVTYQRQTSFVPTTYFNSNTRYYYNLNDYRTNDSNTPAAKLLMWSVYRYAHSSIQGYFPAENRYSDSSLGASGADLDLRGYSYYPIDITTNTTIQGNVKLYNAEFDETENATTCKRKSLKTTPVSQHYTMHNSLFRNVKGNTTLTVSNFKLDGNVSIDANGYCGALIMGTVEGKSSTEPATVTINGLTLNGIKINGVTTSPSTNYAPLLINKSGSNATFTISDVSAGTKIVSETTKSVYETDQVIGSSLLGDLGSSTATFVKVSFSNIKLDGRDEAGKGSDQLNRVYYTNRSLFSRATLLNSLAYADSSSYGTYYYSYSEDYNGNDAKVGSVTYGKEIVGTVENKDSTTQKSKQNKYSDGSYYTHPYEPKYTTDQYADFNTTKYQKYVYTDYNLANKTHELRVNITAASFTGCGTYNDPYKIVSGDNLATIAMIINGTWEGEFNITVPQSVTDSNQDCSWCNGEHTTYTRYDKDSQKWKNSGSDELDNSALRKYLAGAYYKIDVEQTDDIVLPSSYPGLSNNVTDDGFVFHGIIDGSSKTVKNTSSNPLIVSSNGSVVENLIISVLPTATRNLTTNSQSLKFVRSDGCEFYGAVIGQILGGDNIINNVDVTFSSTTPVINANKSSATYAQNVPIGGYVGVVVEGGVIFKGMSSTDVGIPASALTGFGSEEGYSPLTDNKWLYVNPIIGRVINGYAVTESTAYHWSESAGARTDSTGVTLKNGTKNYSIADIYPSLNKLSMEAVSGDANRINVKFPNAQSMFILSILTQSSITANDYNGVKHNANYDEIGPTATTGGDYANVTSTKYPYIVKKYVNDVDINEDGTTDIMQLTTSGISCDFSLGGDESVWYLPDGFKGIGSIGYGFTTTTKMDNRTISLHKFSGKNNYGIGDEIAINLNMSAKHYEDSFDNYLPLRTDNSGSGNGGFGLFDKLRHNNQGTIKDGDKIIDLKLSGKIDYTVVQHGDDVPYTKANVEKPSYLHVGGIAGSIGSGADTDTDLIRVESIDIDGLEINGYESAGGFFGKLNMEKSKSGSVNVSDVSADSFTITSKRYAGGLIGYFGQGNLTVDKISIKNPVILTVYIGDGTSQSVDFDNGAGGVIGFLQNVKTNNGAQLSNITIGELGVTHNSRIGYPVGFSTTTNKDTLVAGGIIGRSYTNSTSTSVYSLIMDNCNVYNTNIYGYRVGGLFGCDSASKNAGTEANIKVINSKVKSDNNSILYGVIPANNKHRSCSGIVGSLRASRGFLIENSSVEGYTIQGYNDTAGLCANDETLTTAHNFTVKDVTLISDYSGSLLGWQGTNANFNGYNILVDNVQFKAANGTATLKAEHGYIVAKNGNKNTKTKLVAFTRQNTDPESGCFVPDRLVGVANTNGLGTDGYVIFADYDGKSQTDKKGTKFADINTTTPFVGDSESPYVYTSPYATLSPNNGTPQIITGDGVSATAYGSSAAKNIINDIKGDESKKRYQNTGITPAEISSLETVLTGKISRFEYELGKAGIPTDSAHYTGGDFPVLVIDDISNVGTIINNYIKLLSNTSYDYQYDITKSGVYSVDISKWVYKENENDDGGVFEKQSGAAALKYDKTRHEFYITTTEQDNVGYQFSLVDVQYKNPSSIGETAYHLYIPVMVEKMLHYTFTERPASGTTYQLSAYPDSETNLVENLGNPVTVKFTYVYQQNSADWAKAINGGEDVQRNYDKKIMLKVTHESGTGLPSNAKLVLVDPNNNSDKMYSADFTNTNSVLVATGSGYGYTQYNLELSRFTGFSVCKLNDLMKVSTDSESTDKRLVECTSSSDPATVIINDSSDPNYGKRLRAATSTELEDSNVTKYAVKVSGWNSPTFTDLQEDYYLSIFTQTDQSDKTIYHFEFDADDSFREEGYPSARTNKEVSHVLLGNLYNNNVTISELNQNSLISRSNNYLSAQLTARVGFNKTALEKDITAYIENNENVAIYQTFLVSLQKIKEQASSMGIVLTPDCTFEYAVNGTPISSTEKKPCKDLGFCVEFPTEHSIKEALCEAAENWDPSNPDEEACKITITATVNMSYAKYDTAMLADQFPESTGSDGNGTKMVGYSNLSSASNNGASSRVSASATGNRLYYMDEVQPVILNYRVDENSAFLNDGNANYGQLGINAHPDANELSDGKSGVVSLISYDASSFSLRRNAEYLRVIVWLSKKGAYNSNSALDIPTYLDNFKLLDRAGSTITEYTETDNVYTYIIPKSLVRTVGTDSYEFEVPVKFDVKSGSGFEGQGLTYSNYRVSVTVSLLDANQDYLRGSEATDWIVYTNARLYRDILPNPMPSGN